MVKERRRREQQPWHVVVVPTIYSASQEERVMTFCFCDCHVTGLRPRKKRTPVVLCVDVVGHVCVTICDKLQSSARLEMAAVVDRPGDVVQNVLYHSQVLWLLHETAHVPNGERNVRPGVNQVR
jgi:hypothetical protein